jgi:hypothetical protein
MPVLSKHLKKPAAATYARLSPLARGRIIGMREAGAERSVVADTVRKTDGSPADLKAISYTYKRFKEDPEYDGTDSSAGGRPRQLTNDQEKAVHEILLRDVGKVKVTARYIKRCLPDLRECLDKTIQRTFARLGYSHRVRRKKSAVHAKHKPARLKYCDWVLRQDQADLNHWAYTDGTTFYLPRTEEENGDKQRAALGPKCWRRSDGSDALQDQNVGPSSYAKSQGKPVKIWGLFLRGRLEYFLLPEEVVGKRKRKRSANMTGARYNQMVVKFFAKWRRCCDPRFPAGERIPLVKDYERFLRWGCGKSFNNLKAERDAGFETIKQYPKCSPDLNAIEGWWDQLQQRLNLTAPANLEPRAAFVKRLRRTVTWMNNNLQSQGRELCENQKTRARQVKLLKGARCKW